MPFEKMVIVCSILALIIGVSSVLPLTFLMVSPIKAEIEARPWFSINISYSYWMTKNGTFEDYEYPEYTNFTETEVESDGYLVVLNITLNNEFEEATIDARKEYYRLQIDSDKGYTANISWTVGTNSNSSFGPEEFHFSRNDWFDTGAFHDYLSGSGGLARYNWTTGQSILWPLSAGGTGTISEISLSSALRKAETWSITLYRVGWVTFTNNSTIITSGNNEIVNQIQLEKFGDGFLYNNLVAENELSEYDLWRPIPFD